MNAGFPCRLLSPLIAVALLATGPQSSHATVYIAEFMADNQTTRLPGPNTPFIDEDGDYSDWIELHNAGPDPVTLNGWYLSDDQTDLRRWQFPVSTPVVTLAANARLVVWASAKDRKVNVGTLPAQPRLHTNFKLDKDPEYLALVRPDGLTVEHSFAPYPLQVQDIAYGFVGNTSLQTLVAEAAPGKARVPLSAADLPATWKDPAFDDSTWQAGQTGFGYDTAGTYGPLIGTNGDLQASMHLVNSTALVRIPFNVADRSLFAGVQLKMKFDDGFFAYLNGTLVAFSLNPGTAQWNSSAIADRAALAIQSYITYPVVNGQNLLVNGPNVLAIHLLNFTNGSTEDVDAQGAPNGSRTLALPVLEGTVVTNTLTPGYLLTATPGTANVGGIVNLGPIVEDTTRLVTRPVGDATSAPLVITTKVFPSLRPLTATDPVQLKYRVMYTPEVSVPMRDDGVAPDSAAADGTYTAQIPTANITAGQMIRWRVEARDNTNVAGTEPPFRDTTDNAQYFGTVVQDGITTSQLPILHWFVQSAPASQTEGGTVCSLFYLGEFYDNVKVNLHGQSSSGFAVQKKSHDFNFPEDNRFKWKEGEIRQRAMNLLTTWADKAKVRDTLAWESWATSRHIAAHWASLTRVQQNGVFWGIYDMVENGDEDFLARAGLDPDGLLYKAYNSLQDTAGVEKKTQEHVTTHTDLQALINGLNPGFTLPVRRQFAYDNVDVPSLANYLATQIVTLCNDFGHKNYYVYQDTNGTREWSVLPWDQDLAIGHTWTTSQSYFNDDIHSQSGLILGAATGNRLMNLIMNNSPTQTAPEMVNMFLRRLRTLMDTMLISATATDGPLEQRMLQMLNQIDPPGAAYLTDSDLDLQKWGYWTDGSGGPIGAPGADAATHVHGARAHVMRIINSNPNPPYPGAAVNAEGLGNTTFPFLTGRRLNLFNGNLRLLNLPIPPSQPAVPANIVIEHTDSNPGNQAQEFFIIRNNNSTYIDVSGWTISGAINYAFRGGTVIPPFISNSAVNATGDVHAGRLHVARQPAGFRARTVSPRGTEFRLVTGGYDGQLSARGGTLELRTDAGTLVTSNTLPANPTAAQTFLRVTELNYAPANPTAQEAAALTGVKAGDFEFVELTNAGTTPLDLGGAQFDHGITFAFPAGYTLAAGARIVLVSSQAAFQLRYGAGAPVAGAFEGNFDNIGERVRLVDSVGEVVLDFTYNPAWYPPTNGGGYTLVTRIGETAYDQYGNPLSWAISGSPGGTPNADDPGGFSQAFEGWRHDYFSSAEISNPAVAGLLADPDQDLDSNFYEYCFGTDPRVAAGHRTPETLEVDVGGTTYRAVRFVRPRKAVDVAYAVEVTSDVGNAASWTPVDLPVGTPENLGGGLERVTYRDNQAAGASPRFFRVRATK